MAAVSFRQQINGSPQETAGVRRLAVRTAEQAANQSSLLDVVDNVLNKGAVLTGDVMLGVANVDLIYVKLSVLLAAFDKVTEHDPIFMPVRPARKRNGESADSRRRVPVSIVQNTVHAGIKKYSR